MCTTSRYGYLRARRKYAIEKEGKGERERK